jgi:hypothetical protein
MGLDEGGLGRVVKVGISETVEGVFVLQRFHGHSADGVDISRVPGVSLDYVANSLILIISGLVLVLL